MGSILVVVPLQEKLSMSADTFVDTNILIYAYDRDAENKHDIAATLLRDLWRTKNGIISTQVLQEFYVNVTAKIPKPLTPTTARSVICIYTAWQIEINTPETILLASEIQERNRLSFWDAMIVAAACQSDAKKILTEDLNHGQIVEGVCIENPFFVTP